MATTKLGLTKKLRHTKVLVGIVAASSIFCPITASAQNLFARNYDSSLGKYTINKIDTNGAVSTFATPQSSFDDLIFDGSGNLFATDYDFALGKAIISKIVTNGVVSTFATSQNYLDDLIFDGSGNLFATDYDSSLGKYGISKIDTNGVVSTFATSQNQFDNLVFAPANATAVPEPFTIIAQTHFADFRHGEDNLPK